MRTKTLQRYDEPGHIHHLTHSCFGRKRYLASENRCIDVAAEIDAALRKHAVDLLAFVFMPEHIHLLVRPRAVAYRIADFCRDFKRESSRRIARTLAPDVRLQMTVRERPGVESFRYWQEGGGHDANIVRPDRVRTVIAYIHANPVRRALCATAEDWRWSSVRRYEGCLLPDEPAIPFVTLFEGF